MYCSVCIFKSSILISVPPPKMDPVDSTEISVDYFQLGNSEPSEPKMNRCVILIDVAFFPIGHTDSFKYNFEIC